MVLSITILTWNTQSVRYNSDGQEIDFTAELTVKIGDKSDLVVIALQEDATRNSPLLFSEESIIANAISENYQLLDLVTLSGWGSTTFKALKNNWEYRPRGLRLAVFKSKHSDIDIINIQSKTILSPGYRDVFTHGKGAAVINIETNYGLISFINMHLPFNSRTLIKNSDTKSIRHSAVMWQEECLRNLYQQVITDYKPDHSFICGDLNFRVQIRTERDAAHIAKLLFSKKDYISELLSEADELRLVINYSKHNNPNSIISTLLEGIDNYGPQFMPTCKMNQIRNPNVLNIDSYLVGSKNHRTPSWCDRILYYSNTDNIKCFEYNRWESGTMSLSDHCAVVGRFSIGNCNG